MVCERCPVLDNQFNFIRFIPSAIVLLTWHSISSPLAHLRGRRTLSRHQIREKHTSAKPVQTTIYQVMFDPHVGPSEV